MKSVRNTALTLVLLGLICLSCNENKPVSNAIDYADTTYWYSCGDQSHEVDVFYVLQVDKSMHLGMARFNDNRDSIVFIPHVTGGHPIRMSSLTAISTLPTHGSLAAT